MVDKYTVLFPQTSCVYVACVCERMCTHEHVCASVYVGVGKRMCVCVHENINLFRISIN